MLTQWLKDIVSAIIIALIINILLYIINDQTSIIGTWEIEISDLELLPGNHYDIIKIYHNHTYEHLTHESKITGYYTYDESYIILYDEEDNVHRFQVIMEDRTIISLLNGHVYKKITRFE